jgi:hypothetical protein
MHGFRDYSTDELEQELRMEQMRADIRLKERLTASEWPKVFTAIIVAFGAFMGVIGAFFGYSLHH